MYRIILILILITPHLGFADQCFVVDGQDYSLKKIDEHKYLLIHAKSGDGIDYHCHNKDQVINCFADDDRGSFIIQGERIDLGEIQTFGSPDEDNYLLRKPSGEVQLKKCD